MSQAKIEDYMTGPEWNIIKQNIVDLSDYSLYNVLANFLLPLATAIPVVNLFVWPIRGPLWIYLKY